MGVGLALQAIGPRVDRARLDADDAVQLDLVIPFALSGMRAWRSSSRRSRTSSSRRSSREEEGQASGANNAVRELGGVFGVAVLASVFAHYGGYTSGQAFVDGMTPAVYVGAAVVALGSVAAFGIKRRPRAEALEPVPVD